MKVKLKTNGMIGLIRISIGLFILGSMLKILHLNQADLLINIALLSLALLYSIRFFSKKSKTLSGYLKLCIVLSWVVHGLLANSHLPYRSIVLYFFVGFVLLWLILDRGQYFKPFYNNMIKKDRLNAKNTLFRITTVTIFLGIVFKVLHLPGGDFLLTSGLGVMTLWSFSSALERVDQTKYLSYQEQHHETRMKN